MMGAERLVSELWGQPYLEPPTVRVAARVKLGKESKTPYVRRNLEYGLGSRKNSFL